MAAPILSISFQTLSISERQFPGLPIECLIMAINNLSKMCWKCELPFRVAGKPTEYFDYFYDFFFALRESGDRACWSRDCADRQVPQGVGFSCGLWGLLFIRSSFGTSLTEPPVRCSMAEGRDFCTHGTVCPIRNSLPRFRSLCRRILQDMRQSGTIIVRIGRIRV